MPLLTDSIRVLNFDDSLSAQQNLAARFSSEITNLKDIGPLCRLWAGKKIAKEIIRTLKPEAKNKVTFLGSGDFHHISSLLVNQFQEPLTIIIFDFHPDWDTLPPKLGCGSWVNRILEKNNIKKVILLGVSSDDISTGSLQTANLKSLKDGRLEIYAYKHAPSKVIFKSVPDNPSITIKQHSLFKEIFWSQLKEKDLIAFFMQLLHRIPTKDVYVSIDKDCLNKNYALTNWEEGNFKLEELLLLLNLIKKNLNIVGLDITGEYSLPVFRNRLKAFCSRMDHPKNYSARLKTDSDIAFINQITNIKILESLFDIS